MGLQPRRGICFFLCLGVWLALSVYSPESVKGHISLPIIQQGLDTILHPAGILEVKCDFCHLCLFLKSSYILDTFVTSTQVYDVNVKVRPFIISEGEFWRRKNAGTYIILWLS